MTVQLLSSSVHVINPWYVKTLEVSVSLHIIDCSTTLTDCSTTLTYSCDRMFGVHAHAPHDPSRTSARGSCGRHRRSPLRPRSTHTPAMPSDASGGWPCLHLPCVSSRAHTIPHTRHTHAHTHAHSYAHTAAYIHTYTHVHTQTHKRTCAHSEIYTNTHTHIRTVAHEHTNTHAERSHEQNAHRHTHAKT
jgi:hypothetical protein